MAPELGLQDSLSKSVDPGTCLNSPVETHVPAPFHARIKMRVRTPPSLLLSVPQISVKHTTPEVAVVHLLRAEATRHSRIQTFTQFR